MTADPKKPGIVNDSPVTNIQSRTGTYDREYLVCALLVFVAKGDGSISSEESDEMLRLVMDHFGLQSSQSLELLTTAMADLAENSEFENMLRGLSPLLNAVEKEEVALMMLKIVAANGRKDVEEMEKFRVAAEIIGMTGDSVHRVYDRYFEETQG